MTSARASLLCMGFLASASAAQEPPAQPNFTGLWKGAPGAKGGITPARLIHHNQAGLSVMINTGVVTRFDCDFERKQCTEATRSQDAKGQSDAKTRMKLVDWEGDALVLSTLVGGAFAGRETWRLSPDGKTLTISVTVFVPSPTGGKQIDAGVGVWKKQE